MRRIILVAFVLGCSASEPSEPAPTPRLELDVLEPEHIKGTYADQNVGVRFESVIDGDFVAVTLHRLDGSELYSSRVSISGETPATFRMNDGTFEGKATQARYEAAAIEEPLDRGDVHDVGDATIEVVKGKWDGLYEYVFAQESALLPALSVALGDAGIDGTTYPAAYSIHMLGLGITQMTGNDPLEAVSKDRAAYNHDGWWFAPHYNNSHFGRCGPGGTCYGWLCGDCGDWTGCSSHDYQCHSCWNDGRVWNCAPCAVPITAALCGSWGHNHYSQCSHFNTGGGSDG